MSKKIQFFILGFLVLVMAGEGYLYYKSVRFQKEPVPVAVDSAEIRKEESLVAGEVLSEAEEVEEGDEIVTDDLSEMDLPAELNLKAVFYAQAPFANWDLPWQEACEEASVLLVANEYFGHNWSRSDFNDEILKLMDWQNERFGDYKHTNVDQTAKMLTDYLGLKTVIHENPTFEDVQRVLARGNFIVMTFAGKKLGNPNYRNGGPLYHAILVKGYKEGEKIITHDVGTRNGEDYVYSWSVVENALHDYADPIESGAKRMIEVLPPDGAQEDKQSPADEPTETNEDADTEKTMIN